jgi:hypothetical protein
LINIGKNNVPDALLLADEEEEVAEVVDVAIYSYDDFVLIVVPCLLMVT